MPDRSRTDPVARFTDPWLDGMARIATLVSGVCLILLIVVFGWLVFGRYVLNATPTWAEQVGLLLIVVIAFVSAAVGVRENTHLNVTILVGLLPPRGRRAVRLLADIIMAGFGGVLAVQAVALTAFGWTSVIPMLDLPEGVRGIPVGIAGAMICLFATVRAVRRCAGARIAEDEEPDPELADALARPDEKGV